LGPPGDSQEKKGRRLRGGPHRLQKTRAVRGSRAKGGGQNAREAPKVARAVSVKREEQGQKECDSCCGGWTNTPVARVTFFHDGGGQNKGDRDLRKNWRRSRKLGGRSRRTGIVPVKPVFRIKRPQ